MARAPDRTLRLQGATDPSPVAPRVVAFERDARSGTAAPPPERAAQRRSLTLAFVDLVDSTAFATRLDPEDLRDVLNGFQAAVAEAVARFDGEVVHVEGDGVLACFGWPSAHEDDAERAVRASLAAMDAVGRLPVAGGEPLLCRIGIATGTVVAVQEVGGLKIYGDALYLASRLRALGPPGAVVLADATRRGLGDLFVFESLGVSLPRGFDVPVEVWRLLGEGAELGRFAALRGPVITPFVGRRREVALLLERWRWATEGDGQLVLLAGEGGIGKSRLALALREQLAAERHLAIGLFCSPHFADTALHPIRGHLRRAAGLSAADPPARQLDRLEALLAKATGRVAEAAALLAELVGIPDQGRYPQEELTPQQRKERTFAVLLDQLDGLAARGPLLIVFEDVHWADPSTLELLQRVAGRIARLPVLLVLTFRPTAGVAPLSFGSASMLRLRPLARDEASAMLAAVVGGRSLEPDAATSILDRSEGVPLYLEELARAVLATSPMAEGAAGAPRASAVPVTLQGSLLAQLDELAGAKDVAQLAAVIGREFRRDVLAAVTGIPDRLLGQVLARLVAAGLLARTGSDEGESYAFKHALLADAAYETLLRSRRRELHGRVARALQESFAEICDDCPEILAHHCAMAGLARAAIDYRCRAGERAAQHFANAEAIEHYRQALDLLAELPAEPERDRIELTIRMAMGAPLMAARGYSAPELHQSYDRAHELCLALDTAPALFPILFGLSLYYLVRSELRAARPLVARCLVAARAARDDELLLESCCLAGSAHLYHGRFAAARRVLARGLALYRPERDRDHAARFGQDPMLVLGFIARVEAMLGRPSEVGRHGAALHAWLRDSDARPSSVALLHAQLAHARLLLREPSAALDHAEIMVEVSARHGLPLWLGLGRMYRGAGSVQAGLVIGDPATISRGLADGGEGLAMYRTIGAELDVPTCLCWLAAGSLRLGDLAAAAPQLDEARQVIAATGQTYFAAEVERLTGELRLAGRDPDLAAARRQFEAAMAIARRQGAKLLELRAAIRLAGLAPEHGPDEAAHMRLRLLLDGFSAGEPCRDVEEARAVLAGWAAPPGPPILRAT